MKIFQLIDLIIRLFRLNKKSKVVLLFLIPTFLVGQNNAAFWLGKRPSGAAPTNLLLDDYPGAAAAYSLRKLDKDYGGFAVEVRRSSDGATQNIGFSNNDFDTASLNSFCSGTSCTVRTWYDQSGNGRDAVQTTVANQPLIYASGSVFLVNGRPAISWPNYSSDYFLKQTSISLPHPITFFLTVYYNGTSGRQDYIVDSNSGLARTGVLHAISNNKFGLYAGGSGSDAYLFEPNVDLVPRQLLFTILFNSVNSKIYKNNINTVTGGAAIIHSSMNGLTIGNFFSPSGGTYNWSGLIQEIIIYGSNKTENSIENNINTYYSIY